MGRPKINLSGQRFERWLVISEAGADKFRNILWLCRCNCGNERIVAGSSLRSGHTKSCGCLAREVAREMLTTHGVSRTVEYSAWNDARYRCTNPKNDSWARYGGRGIQFKLPDFQEFFEHIGPRPSPKHSLDRIDNKGHYAIGNIRWGTKKIQDRNRRSNRWLFYMGETLCVTDWTEKLGFKEGVVLSRLNRGWTVERALGTPVHKSSWNSCAQKPLQSLSGSPG